MFEHFLKSSSRSGKSWYIGDLEVRRQRNAWGFLEGSFDEQVHARLADTRCPFLPDRRAAKDVRRMSGNYLIECQSFVQFHAYTLSGRNPTDGAPEPFVDQKPAGKGDSGTPSQPHSNASEWIREEWQSLQGGVLTPKALFGYFHT